MLKMPSEDQILAQELARLQKERGSSEEEGSLEKEQDLYEKLAEDFPLEAMNKDSSRGFDLTSVKAQYVVERLNTIFGMMNWSHGGEFKEVEDGILYLGGLVVTVDGKQNKQFAPGFSKIKKNNLGDAYKSAKTDSLCKAASMFGVANSVFKGLVDAKSLTSSAPKKATARSRKSSEEAGEPVEGIGSKVTKRATSFAKRTRKSSKA